ncbi:MFS family permease [Amycolatopsis bartoniae]|uniref:MFS transporter n=1 Tax=Amycolatopsis bartoniae TaxID=941986 RepID=UPI001605B340|nr:MFS transporter [Amycolatopsis bartoniae]MBB2936592.1 MFS family permease [Amycolatopsis bartoniae]
MDSVRTGPPRAASLVLLCLIALTYSTLEGMVAPALPVLQSAFGASPSALAWVFTGLLLAGTVASPLIGRLADVHGPKRVLLTVLALVALGTLLAALAGTMVLLALGQVLQGFGLGFVPLSIAILSGVSRGSGKAGVGVLIGMSGFGTVAGGLLAGPLLLALSYRFIYWIPFGVLILAGLLAAWLLPATEPSARGRIDWVGAVLLAGGLVALLLGITFVPTSGWGSVLVLALLAAAVVLLASFFVVERRTAQPLVALRVGGRAMVATYVIGLATGWAGSATFVLLPLIVAAPPASGYGLGESPLVTGSLLTVFGVLGAASAPLAAPLERLLGARLLLVLSCLPLVAAPLVLILGHLGFAGLVVAAGLIGLGIGLGFSQAMNVVVGTVPADRIGSASSAVYVVRGVGSTLGAQVTGSLLTVTLLPGLGVSAWSGFLAALVVSAVVAIVAAAAAGTVPRNAVASPRPVALAEH